MNLIGKERIINFFEQARSRDMVSHLYILEGDRGIGKKTIAGYLARKFHCESGASPCDKCHACIKHLSGNHPDFIKITREKDKMSIGVDSIREFIADMYVKPLVSDKKIYVIYDGETLSPQAQNALLKVLEEPPEYIMIFILTQSAEALLSTVLSRGVLLSVDRCSSEQIKEYITEKYPDKKNIAEIIVSFAGGVLGIVDDMAEGRGVLSLREQLYDLMPGMANGKRTAIYPIINCFEKNKDNIYTLFDLMHLWLRDAIIIKTAKDEDIINCDYKEQISNYAQNVTAASLVHAADRISAVMEKMGKGSNITLWVTDLLINCWEDFHGENNRSQV